MKKFNLFGRSLTAPLLIGLLFVGLVLGIMSGCNDIDKKVITAAGQIAEPKRKSVDYVKELKRKVPKNTKDYADAQRLYNEAMGKFENYITQLTMGIRANVDMNSLPSLKTAADDANAAAIAFIGFAESKLTPPTPPKGPEIHGIIDPATAAAIGVAVGSATVTIIDGLRKSDAEAKEVFYCLLSI